MNDASQRPVESHIFKKEGCPRKSHHLSIITDQRNTIKLPRANATTVRYAHPKIFARRAGRAPEVFDDVGLAALEACEVVGDHFAVAVRL